MAQKKDLATRKWFYYGSYKLDDGKNKQYKKRGFDSKGDAKEAERLFLLEINEIFDSRNSKLFTCVVDTFFEADKRTNKAITYETHKIKLSRIIPVFGNDYISKIKPKKIQDFLDGLIDEGLAYSYVESFYYFFNMVFKYAILHNLVSVNPVKKVLKPIEHDSLKKEMGFWTPSEFKCFIGMFNKEKDHVYYILFLMLYLMGCRKCEALALQWKDINFDRKTIRIEKSVNYKLKGIPWVLTTPKNKNAYRTISIPATLLIELKEWYELCSNMHEFTKERFLFGYDRPLGLTNVTRKFNLYTFLAGSSENQPIPPIRIHDLRHSHASYLINSKMYDYDIARRLGDTVQTLHNTYAHWFDNAEDDIIKKMDSDF